MTKRIIFLISMWCLFAIHANDAPRKTICLNMIVKNESKVILRCLGSVKNIIDYWVIVDTGSEDGTQELIKNFMRDVPGELHERPWINFAHNRNEALALTKNKGDYVLVIDADEKLSFSDSFKLPALEKDVYYILSRNGGTTYYRSNLVNNHLNWKWIGVLHEGLDCPEKKTAASLEGVINQISWDGSRSQDPQKYQKDAQVLEEALKSEPMNGRYVFYLAQSYRDAGNLPAALKNYEKVVSMRQSDQEVCWSLSEIAKLQDQLQMEVETVVNSYCRAYQFQPTRAEPLYYLARKYNMMGNYCLAYMILKFAQTLPIPQNFLFVENWIYDYALLQELATSSFRLGRVKEAQEVCEKLLSNQNLPDDVRKTIENNLQVARLQHQPTTSSGYQR